MTKEEIVEKAKYIIVPNYCEIRGTLNLTEDFISFMSTHEGVELHGEKEDLCKCEGNEHHFVNHWIYENTLWAAFKLLNIKFNPLDYYKVNNFSQDKDIITDFSYIMPYNGGSFEISCDIFTPYDENCESFYVNKQFKDEGDFSILIARSPENVPNAEYFRRSLGYPTTDYHTLYRCPHQCSLIKNKTINNGKKLLISCDSHSIPIIPILANYYEEVAVMDSRVIFSQKWIYGSRNFDDVLFVMSPINFLEKYTEDNLQ